MSAVKRLPEGVEPHVPMLMGLVFGEVRERLAEHRGDLRPSQARVLEWIPPGGVTISELAERVSMTTQGCGQFVRQLAGLGMVDVAVADHDARARRVVTTATGRAALARTHDVLAASEREWRERVGDARYDVFREVLAEVALGGSPGPDR